ncbi:MAG: ATP-binding cassette domain-containing protein [Comamonas sp.]
MIEIRDLSLTYKGPKGPVHALHNIHLEIASGEVFGIIGRSGAGKSSLVRCLNLLNRPTSGQVVVNGRDLMTLAGASKDDIYKRVTPLLELVGLDHLSDRYPAQISGGQKQRVGIARALASNPKVLLSDEATSALDPETTRSILDLLRKVNRELGVTVVLITHQMQVIKQIADRVAVIDGGEIAELGSVIEVFTRPQQAITKSLIDEIVPQELPESVMKRVGQLAAQLQPGQQGQLLRLSYAGESAYQPILSHLIRELGLDLSILHGQIDEIQEQTFGSLAVYASGDAARIEAAIAHLRASGVQVQIVPSKD